MKANQLFHLRIDYDDGAIVEMVLWRVPSRVAPSTQGLKYSWFYGRPGEVSMIDFAMVTKIAL
jgi:hypothetical protein